MIVQKKRTWLRTVFAIRGSSLEQTWARIATVTIFSILVTWGEYVLQLQSYSLTPMPFTLMGLTMAIFLGFRNGAAYDRYWEGRKLWGSLVNTSRSFTRQTLTLIVPATDDVSANVRNDQVRIVRSNIAYVQALRHHLRGTEMETDVRNYLDDDSWNIVRKAGNRPITILQLLGDQVCEQWQSGRICDIHLPILENSLTEFTNVQGACERIKNTPIPFTYNVLIHRIVAGYCFAMPFGLISTTGVMTPVVVALIAYGFFGLDAIGDDIEQPFELDQNDLPLDAISRTIEINLLESIGAEDIPPPLSPKNGVLM